MLDERDQLTDLDKQILFEATVFLGPDRVEDIQDVAFSEVLEELIDQPYAPVGRHSDRPRLEPGNNQETINV